MYTSQQLDIVGGLISPVHNAYGKPSLVPAEHRLEMCRLACATSDWIATSGWEILQAGWTTTAATMQAYSAFIAAAYPQLQPPRPPPRLLLLCGADLLESFLVPGLWHPDDLDAILGQHGVAVIERVGLDLPQLLASSPLLSRYTSGIHIVPQRVVNNVSSTIVRENVSRGLSIAYLVPPAVAAYIHSRQLYGHDQHRESMRRRHRAIPHSSTGSSNHRHWKAAEVLEEEEQPSLREAEAEPDPENRSRAALNGREGKAGKATAAAHEGGHDREPQAAVQLPLPQATST
jgi:nicotinamide mononucleotide adenylyltransferase